MYVPLDPKYLPEFQYQSKGFVQDMFLGGAEKSKLKRKLQSVLTKYDQFKYPYFVNYLHIARGSIFLSDDNKPEAVHSDSNLKLFQLVLTRLGFTELMEFNQLTLKLVYSTELNFDYSNFITQIKNHIKSTIDSTLFSWISEVGSRYRKELPLFVYYLWDSQTFVNDIKFIPTGNLPLVRTKTMQKIQAYSEKVYLDILVTRFRKTLENFDPQQYLNIYKIDSMDGYQFESFLVQLFTYLGYDVEETKKAGDQGADLFVSKFGTKTVIQAKNYKDNVGNAAIQQALSAKAFYDCNEAMVVTNSYFTHSAIELANKTSVKLVDRSELEKYIDEYNQLIIEAMNESENDSPNPVKQTNRI
ncbi:MAG: restriction endonuclease [Anaerolineales bacterium]|nr:restriction endonuclease [Anaerolineales bacterium]